MTTEALKTPVRPSRSSKEIDRIVADGLLPKAIEWLRQGGEEDSDEEDVRNDLLFALDFYDDGYQIARQLDNKGWAVDSELVDILDNATHYRYQAHSDAVAKWVEDNQIRPTLGLEDEVWFKLHGEKQTGVIIAIDAKHANYTVCCPSKGHKRKGNGTHGFILPYEDVARTEDVGIPAP